MHRKLSSHALVLALVAAATLAAAPSTALARDQRGLGIGANVTLGGLSGLALNIWVSNSIMLEAMIVTSINMDRGAGHDARFDLGGSFGVFGVLASAEMTNLMLGGRIGVLGLVNSTGRANLEDDAVILEGDVALRVEHWFDDHFSINAQVGLQLTIVPDPGPMAVGVPGTAVGTTIGQTSGLFGGAGFTYYFDSSESEEHEERERSAPAAAPATGAAQPSWE